MKALTIINYFDFRFVLRPVFVRYAKNNRGATAILFALILPVLLLAVVGSIDTAIVYHQHSALQDATDAGAIAAAQRLQTGETRLSTLRSEAFTAIAAQLSDKVDELHVDLKVDQDAGTVEVRVDHKIMPPMISGTFGTKSDRIYAWAKSRISEESRRVVLSN